VFYYTYRVKSYYCCYVSTGRLCSLSKESKLYIPTLLILITSMRFLNRIKGGARNRFGSEGKASKCDLTSTSRSYQKDLIPSPPESNYTARLSSRLLAAIFANVCPHSQDASYKSSEESMTDGGCMLCDMRDLAHCAVVCKRWSVVAQRLL
jgi:hypothetical protein